MALFDGMDDEAAKLEAKARAAHEALEAKKREGRQALSMLQPMLREAVAGLSTRHIPLNEPYTTPNMWSLPMRSRISYALTPEAKLVLSGGSAVDPVNFQIIDGVVHMDVGDRYYDEDIPKFVPFEERLKEALQCHLRWAAERRGWKN